MRIYTLLIALCCLLFFIGMRQKLPQQSSKCRIRAKTLPKKTTYPTITRWRQATIISIPIAAVIAKLNYQEPLISRFDYYFHLGIAKDTPQILITAINQIDARSVSDLLTTHQLAVTHQSIIDPLTDLQNRALHNELTPIEERNALEIMTAINIALSKAHAQAQMSGYSYSAHMIEGLIQKAWELEFRTHNHILYRDAERRKASRRPF